MFDLNNLQHWLDNACAEHEVVGTALAILAEGNEYTAASGVLNLDTGIEATADSAFQIGSITKVFTATLLMQLVDEGKLDIEQPVKTYLPEFGLADSNAAATITVKQLLNHSSGLDGEHQVNWDPDDHSVKGFVAQLKNAPMLSPPGYIMTYCNAGWVVLGRLVEVLHDGRYPELVMQHICEPLGMQQAFCRPTESLKFRCASGHDRGMFHNEPPRVAATSYLPLHSAPTGSVLSMSASDLLRFGKAHLDPANSPLLSATSCRAMQSPTIELPPLQSLGYTHQGLGWRLGINDGYTVLAHDGGTLGQYAYLRVYPRHGVVVSLLTNSISTALYAALDEVVLEELIGVETPQWPETQPFDMPARRYEGVYANGSMRIKVEQGESTVNVALVDASNTPITPALPAAPYRDESFKLDTTLPLLGDKFHFLGSDDAGRAKYFRIAARMLKRVA